MHADVGPGSDDPAPATTAVTLRYATADAVRRDRLREFPRGLIARTRTPVEAGDVLDVRLEVVGIAASVSARAEVRWATPIGTGAVAGLALSGASHRDDVKLDVLLGIRGVGTADAEHLPAGIRAVAGELSVALLQPNPVLRQAFAKALDRYTRGKAGGVRVATAADAPGFLAAVAERPPDLAVIDCDGLGGPADPLVDAVRSRDPSAQIPVILLSDLRSPRLDDRHTVTMRKPVWMKALLHTAELLLRS